MARLHVISSELPPPGDTTSAPLAAGVAANDEFDRHNKPRLRQRLILTALQERYPDASFAAPPPAAAAAPDGCDLPRLYGRVHDEQMVAFLLDAWSQWEAMGPRWDRDNCLPSATTADAADGNQDASPPPLVPCHSAFRRGNSNIERPSSNVMGAIGYYCTDFITPIVATLAGELRQDAAIICSAVDRACDTRDVVYAVTTHPGHHASADCFGGYCYLNNAALCARLLQRRLEPGTGDRIIGGEDGKIASNFSWNDSPRRGVIAPVAILDIDYHCGNGTASIFYGDFDVLFCSIHCTPDVEYPWNTGYEDQNGAGAGKGETLHIPLAPGASWENSYKPALEKALRAIVEFGANALVVSIGLDTHEGDKVAVNRGGFELSGKDYYQMGRCMGSHIAKFDADAEDDMPVVFVQEGGYRIDVVGSVAADVVGGFAAAIGERKQNETEQKKRRLMKDS
ncbi:hypothetical protein ACHAXT_011341 [Thalassiosira profunda]